MKGSSRCVFSILFIVAALLIITAKSQAQTRQTTGSRALTLGIVFQGGAEPVKKHFHPLVDYAARKLSPNGATTGIVMVAPTQGQMMKLLEEKRVDFYMESAYPTYLINRLGAARILLRRWKGGVDEYRSIIFTRERGSVTRLDDLRGKIMAFEDPGSTSGYFLPKLLLLKKGFAVLEKANLETKVAANEIGYIFAGTSDKVVSLVLQEKLAAGAISSDDYSGLEDKNKRMIAVLGETEPMPRHLLSVRKDLPEPVVKRLKEVLLNMHQDEEGRKILREADGTTRFDLLPGGEERIRRTLIEVYRQRRTK
jgi:phosphonate transport system substrate-binding protein